MLDKIDKAIIRELQIDSKRKTHQLSKVLNIPRTTIHNRIKHLEKNGFIKGYKAVVDPAKLGKNVVALVHMVIGSQRKANEIIDSIKKLPFVEEAYVIAGQFDIMAKVSVKNAKELSNLVYNPMRGLRSWEGVTRSESMIVLETIKENGVIVPED